MQTDITSIMKKILSLTISILLLFISCSKEEEGNRRQPAKRTVIAYMAAENTLSGYVNNDINEMIEGVKSISQYDNMLVFVDRASSVEKPFIIRLQGDDQQPADTIMRYEQDFYSSDPDKMREVLQWAMTNYPADDYGLILWGHGNGWVIMEDSVVSRRAIAVDNGENKGSDHGLWMNIPSMRVALEALPHPFKFIFCDCCNMQNIEVAYELKDVTDYLISSPAGITSEGAPYNMVIPAFFNYDDTEMYTKVCDEYHAVTDWEGGHLPLSVIRTTSLPLLANATKSVLHSIYDNNTIIDTDNLIYYYSYSLRSSDEHVMYDMNDFIMRHADEADYQDWLNIFNQVVVYKKRSTRWQVMGTLVFDFEVTEERYGGVSMFVPLDRYEDTLLKYNQLITRMGWYHAVGWSELGW